MRVACGWAEFIDTRLQEVVARGHVTLLDIVAPRRPGRRWNGEVRHLRGEERLRGGTGAIWLIRFEHGSELRWVELGRVDASWSPSGRRATAQITSHDEEVPSAVTELGGE